LAWEKSELTDQPQKSCRNVTREAGNRSENQPFGASTGGHQPPRKTGKMAHFRLTKPGTIAHVEACIVEALRENDGGYLTTTQLCLHHQLVRHFHGMRTLDLGQVARVCKKMVADGRLESQFHGVGNRTGSMYRIVASA
jgi:hypothetical protein